MTLSRRLAGVDLLSGLSETALEAVAEAGTVFTHNPGHQLVRKGDAGPGLRVVLEGEAEVDVDGVQRSVLAPGDYFGEISLIDAQPASASVTAGQAGLKTFAVSPATFNTLLDRNPEMARVILRSLCARLRTAEAVSPGPLGS